MFPSFPSIFIRTSILIAFWAGINMGSHVAYMIGFDFPLGKGYLAYIQTHGYLQLMGWVGLFIMGVSIYFLSRLAHFPYVDLSIIKHIYIFMVTGLIIRFISHSFLPYLTESDWYLIIGLCVVFSSVLIFLGIGFYLRFLLSVIKEMKPVLESPNRDIRIFIIINFIGWLIFGIGMMVLLTMMVIDHHVSLPNKFHLFLVDLFIHFTIFPICIAVSLRALPLFFRLPSIKWNARIFSFVYLVIILFIFNLRFINIINDNHDFTKVISGLVIVKDFLLIWFVFKLEILLQFFDPWIDKQKKDTTACKKRTRNALPDYGQFGHFEWLIRPAFFWLTIGCILDIFSQIGILVTIPIGIGIDGIRHMWLAGFVSLLIMGMAIRMIPGMVKSKQLVNSRKVAWLAIIMNTSVLFRTSYLVIPESILNIFPNGSIIALRIFGLSGLFFLIGLIIFYYSMKPILTN